MSIFSPSRNARFPLIQILHVSLALSDALRVLYGCMRVRACPRTPARMSSCMETSYSCLVTAVEQKHVIFEFLPMKMATGGRYRGDEEL